MTGGASRGRLLLLTAAALAATVCVAVLGFGGAIPAENPFGLDPGYTPWLLPLTRLAMEGAAVVTVGCLIAAVFLVPGEHTPPGERTSPGEHGAGGSHDTRLVLGAQARRWLHVASWSAVIWALAAAGAAAFTIADLLGVSVGDAASLDNLYVLVTEIPAGKALAAVFVLALVVATACQYARSVSAAGAITVIAVAAVLPPTFTGHAAAAASHELALSATMLHVLGAVLWTGGLLALVLGRQRPTLAVQRFSRLALGCIILVGVSGVVSALVRVNAVADLLTRYGVLLGGKLLALCVLAGFGWWHRRSTLPALAEGRPGAFVRIAGVEIFVLAATFGLAAGLARTPPPSKLRIDELLEIPLRRAMEWLPDLVFLTIAAAAVLAYLAGLRRLRDTTWPASRTAAWIAGWLLVVAATDLQLARTGAGMFGLTDRIQHLMIGVLAPLLLAAGRAGSLAGLTLRPSREPAMRGPMEWLTVLRASAAARVLRHPTATTATAAVGVYALYLGVHYSFAITSHAAHLAVLATALTAGLIVAGRLLDPGLPDAVRVTLGTAVLALISLIVLVFTISAALPSSLSDDPGRAVPPATFTGQWVATTCLAVLVVWIACTVTGPATAPATAPAPDIAGTDAKSVPAQRVDPQTPNRPRRFATGAERAP